LPDAAAYPPASQLDGGPIAAEWRWRDGSLAWHEWDETVQLKALSEERPLLFYVAAPGCEGLFAENSPLLQEMIEQRYVGVRVDPFTRPDLVRYLGIGGCPALAVALPDGRVFTRAVDIPARYTALFLQRSLDAFEGERETIVKKLTQRKQDVGFSVDIDSLYKDLLGVLIKDASLLYGPQKIAHVRSLRFIWQFAELRGDSHGADTVRRAFKDLLRSPLRDVVDGGFYLYSYTPDGLQPIGEKDALDHAELAHWFLDMGEQAAARDVLSYMRRVLYEKETGALRGRQVRLPEGGWWTDPIHYADRSAAWLRVLVRVAREQGDREAEEMALATAAFLRRNCIDARGAVSRECSARGVRGLLVDQGLVALALEELAAWSGDRDDALLAQRVAAFAEEQLYSVERGSFAASAYWPGKQQFSFADGEQSAGNVLMIEWYGRRGDLARARRLLAAARFEGAELGVATTWAQMALKYEEAKVR
jgi:uncharacterized protein YyaL (SSP411 family)